MNVEAVSFPEDLKGWDPEQQPFYFELLGETTPVLDATQGELAAVSGTAGSGSGTRIFEYVWTIGHPGVSQHRPSTHRVGHGAAQAFEETETRTPEFWHRLKDPAAEVHVYFPQAGNWRVSELGATVKYLSPLPEEESFLDKVAKDAQLMQPVATAVGQLANVAAPGVGSVVSGSARVVAALAQMKMNSVPQTAGFPWSVTKTVRRIRTKQTGRDEEPMAGVAWSLPKSMFEELGGRISGSVAVVFVPVRTQIAASTQKEPGQPEPRHVVAHAVVRTEREPVWAPGRDRYIELRLAPTAPEQGSLDSRRVAVADGPVS